MRTHKERLENKRTISKRGCWLYEGDVRKDGYANFAVKDNGIWKTRLAHRVSYEEYVGKIPKGKMVLHKCDVRNCTNPEHLFIGDQVDNMRDAANKNRLSRDGENNGRAKLNNKSVIEIREQIKMGDKFKDIASKYNISNATIYLIADNKIWRNV